MIFVDTTSASPSATRPVSGAGTLTNNMKYVNNNIHNFILLPSFVLSFIYSYIYVLTPFFKLDFSEAGSTPSRRSYARNSRGIGGILP